jgi:hypothetical protein
MAQGPSALPTMASLLTEPHMAGSDKTTVLYCMSVITDVPALIARLASAKRSDLELMLTQPQPEWIAALDVVAAWAASCFPHDTMAAAQAALDWRFALRDTAESDAWADVEPTMVRLPRVFVRYAGAKAHLQAQLAQVAKGAHQYRNVLQAALGAMGTPVTSADFTGVELTCRMKDPDYDAALYRATVQLKSQDVLVRYGAERIYFEGFVAGQAYEQTRTIGCASPSHAQTLAARIGACLALLGFNAGKQPKRKGSKP